MAIRKQLSPVKTQLIFADMLSTDTPLLKCENQKWGIFREYGV